MQTFMMIVAILYSIFICVLSYTDKKNSKIAVIVWRAGSILTLSDIIISYFTKRPLYTCWEIIALLFMCFLFFPLASETCTCHKCGRRVYWRPLFRSRCRRCSEYYW